MPEAGEVPHTERSHSRHRERQWRKLATRTLAPPPRVNFQQSLHAAPKNCKMTVGSKHWTENGGSARLAGQHSAGAVNTLTNTFENLT